MTNKIPAKTEAQVITNYNNKDNKIGFIFRGRNGVEIYLYPGENFTNKDLKTK